MTSHRPTTGVLLIQLGTPHEPTVPAVRRFLREFLSDPRVLDISFWTRFFLVNVVIAPFRAPKSTRIYKKLWDISDGESPLRSYSVALTESLNARVGDSGVTVHLAMRYQGPSIPDVLREMRTMNYDKILVLPLFPQYASSSSGTALQCAMNEISRWWVIPHVEFVSQFHTEDFYTSTLVEQARKHDLHSFDHIVMSYHGLPERQVDKVYEGADDLCASHDCEHGLDGTNQYCYKATCYATSRIIAKKLDIDETQYTVSFQSRLDEGWLRPFSDEVIANLARQGNKRVLVFSPSFVADCLETLIEVGDEYQEIFVEHGGEQIQLVASCNLEERWVSGLSEFIRARSLRPVQAPSVQ